LPPRIHSLVSAPRVPAYQEQVRLVRYRGSLRAYAGALREVGPGDVVVVNGALGWGDRYRDLVAALLAGVRRRGAGIIVLDANWLSRSLPSESRAPAFAHAAVTRFAQRLLLALDGRRTIFCLLSDAERQSFAREAGVPLERVVVTPFFATVELSPRYDELVALARSPQPFVFAGGDTLRDYGLLREALGGTAVQVRVATRRTAGSWPSNFEAGPLSATEFQDTMAASRAVVMPLNASTPRSTGQQSYLNAMRLGKPTIVNDAVGVREHVAGGAFVVPPRDPAALRERVEWVLANPESPELRAVVERGIARTTGELTMEAYYMRILELARGL